MFDRSTFLPNPHDANQEPAWRWLRCQYLLEYNREPVPDLDDAVTQQAWRFLRELRLCRDDADHERLAEHHPLLAAAYQLFRHAQPLKRAEIEARLLAGEDDDTIAQKCNLWPPVVAVYHGLFFAVRPNLQAEIYIVNRAIGPRVHGPLTLADKDILLKLIGYQMGGLMIDKVLDCFADPPVCPADLTQLDDRALEKLREKLRLQALLLLATLPAEVAATEQFLIIRQLLAQAGALGHETSRDVKNSLWAIETVLDWQDSVSEPEAAAHNVAAPAQAEVAHEWCAVPA